MAFTIRIILRAVLFKGVSSAYFPQSPENYVFRIAAADPLQTDLAVHEAIDVRKYKRPAVLCDDTNYGQGGRAKLEAALSKRSVTPVSFCATTDSAPLGLRESVPM